MTKKITVLIVALLSASCADKEAEPREPMDSLGAERNALPDNGEGRAYIKELAAAVGESDRIVVTEHSNVDDVLDELTQPQRPKDYRPIIYAARELSPLERSKFLIAIRSMAVATQDAEPACIFEPHHTITFFRANRQTSAMRICFQCGQVEWDGSSNTRPWSLVPTLQTLIAGLGMKEERNWRTLARTATK